MGTVIVALTTNEEVRAMKGYDPELDYEARKEILESIRYVDEVVPCKWTLDDAFLDEHRVDLLVHGSDNRNPVSPERLVILPRTPGISSTLLRARALEVISSMVRREIT
jgi:glycerol-3-phosphate cytidylyltransferase